LARPDFRSQAAQRLAGERHGHTPALIDLLRPGEQGRITEVHRLSIDRVSSNPSQPRQHFDEGALQDLAASIREHGILQPVLVRPRGDGTYQIVAGERRWRAARLAGLVEVPAIIEQIDDESALEIAIIENLQREDISPLEEADMFERMTSQHGYSLRKLAQKLGKDKGYIENRLRLADAPPEVRELVSRRRDTLSAAYELMKVSDSRKRRRLAAQVASGELSLAKLRVRIEGRPPHADGVPPQVDEAPALETVLEEMAVAAVSADAVAEVDGGPEVWVDGSAEMLDDVPIPGIDLATEHLARAVNELALALQTDVSLSEATGAERQQFAKYLTIAKIKLENAIAVVRTGDARDLRGGEPDL
jgi:ParB family transcriptional regulator, chromosome partitioning protein